MKKVFGLLIVSASVTALILSGCQTTSTTTTTTTSTTLSGMVAHWALNEGSGYVAGDSSGNGHNGAINGATWTTGRSGSGSALSFDGTNDSVRIPGTGEAAPSQIAGLTEGTIAIWFRFDQAAGTSGIFLPLFYLGSSPEVSDTRDGLIIEVGHKGIWNTSQELFYTVTLTGSSEPILCFDSDIDLTVSQWYHFAVTVSSSGNTGFLNGAEMTSRDYNFADASATNFLSSVPSGMLAIGCGRSAIDQQIHYFNGVIDDVQIYNRALSSSEVQQLYQQ